MRTLCLFVISLWAACATPQTASTATVRVESVIGAAEFLDRDGAWKPLRAGQRIRPGATVQTSADSRVHFHLGKAGGVLALHPDSTLTFEQIGPGSDPTVAAILSLTRGRVTGDTLKLPDARKIVVKTLGGVHEIR